MLAHDLAAKLLEMDNVDVLSSDGALITGVDKDSYSDAQRDDVPCVVLEEEE